MLTTALIVLLIGLAVPAAMWCGLKLFEWKNLYHPFREIERTPDAAGVPFENVTLVTADDHRLHGWWLPNPVARVTVLMCHGNTGNISHCIERITDLHAMGAKVFIFDYRGYGKSRGLSTERGLYLDAEAAYEWIRTTQYDNIDHPPIILYGHSLGGAIAVKTALEKSIAGLILESTFTSIPEMSRHRYRIPPFLARLVTQRFDSLSRIAAIHEPLLIAAGPDDTRVPCAMGRELFDRAKAPKQFCLLTGDHDDSGWRSTPAFGQAVAAFIQAHNAH